ncbi:hypothetical protein BDR26DRAFT_915780 [Obelidium mucronatum]|nr:hypothetical protein BDR26DRAFT_915780 [Obelidium mucronatum]
MELPPSIKVTSTSPTLGSARKILTIASNPTVAYSKCAPRPPKVPLTIRSCIPDPSGICLGLGLCYLQETSVEGLFACDGSLIQTNNELNITDNINVGTSNFTVPTVSTGGVCDNFPEAVGRCAAGDICLYPPAPANQTAPAVCTKRPANLPPKVTSTNSNNPSCIPDSNTRETCSGLWICFIGNNGFESVYYCDGQIDYSKGSPNFIAWHNPFGTVFGVLSTTPSTINESASTSSQSSGPDVGMIAGVAVGVLLAAGIGLTISILAKKRANLKNFDSTTAVAGSIIDEKAFDASISLHMLEPPPPSVTTSATTGIRDSVVSAPLSPSGIESAIRNSRFEKPKEATWNVQSVPGFYRTLEEFRSEIEDELSYPKDARVYVTSKPDVEGWCHALIAGSYGLVHDSKLGPIG